MRKQIRRYGTGAAIAGAVVGAAAFALPAHEPAWRPITRNLATSPERLLPAVVSATRPVRVVSTSVGRDGRPVVTVRAATDRAGAVQLVVDGQRRPGAVAVEVDAPVSVAAEDPYRSAQWDFATTRVAQAWQRSTGRGVTVAVVDSGVDATHPDLAGQVLPGADFITGLEGTAVDPHGHGTHVAGTIAALAGNDTGVTGIAPQARILPVRVLAANGSGYMSDVANGIAYAAEHGADVINMSISSTWQVAAVSNAIAYARSRGVAVVAAAGNARAQGSPTSYPAADPGVIAVAATTSADTVAGYSTSGGYVDVAAPGSDILSTYPGGQYVWMNGTSMAAPHVAAVAALLKGADRGLTPDQIEQALTVSAVDLGRPGRDDDFGAGRLDAAAALATVAPGATDPALDGPAPSGPVGTDPTPTGPATTDPTPTGPAPSSPTATGPAPSSPAGTDPARPAPTGPAAPTTPPTTPTPTQQPTRTPQAPPTTTTPVRPAPTTPVATTPAAAKPQPTMPAPSTPAVTPSTAPSPAPARPVIRLIRPSAGRLTVVIMGCDGAPAEIQRFTGVAWQTVRTYPAAKITQFTDLAPGLEHRVVVCGTTSTVIRL